MFNIAVQVCGPFLNVHVPVMWFLHVLCHCQGKFDLQTRHWNAMCQGLEILIFSPDLPTGSPSSRSERWSSWVIHCSSHGANMSLCGNYIYDCGLGGRNTGKFLIAMRYLASTMCCLLSVCFFCWFDAILASFCLLGVFLPPKPNHKIIFWPIQTLLFAAWLQLLCKTIIPHSLSLGRLWFAKNIEVSVWVLVLFM